MKNIRNWVVAAVGAALLAACGGDDPSVPGSGSPRGAPATKGNFTNLVVFGDSLSDIGTYQPATAIPGTSPTLYWGGKFTTNSNGGGATIWVENLATALGIVITPAEVGFAGQSVPCPAGLLDPDLAGTCTGYAQGGSRVTDDIGIGHFTSTGALAALTVPVKTQIANHLARFGSFKATDLVVVFAGNNDAFAQFGAFSAAATQIQTDALAGRISSDEANRRLFNAQTAAQEEMKKAALELAGYIKTQILAKGGKYVAVWNLPDSSLTPFGASLKLSPATAGAVPVLVGLVDVFNLWLREGLTDQPVQLVDANSYFRDAYQNPSKYGMTNNTQPACDGVKIAANTQGAVTDGTSLFCSSDPIPGVNGLADGADVNTWQFADGVHPTTGGHRLISDNALLLLRGWGWIN